MPVVYTVGHGNRTVEELIATLTGARVTRLVDVRAYPRSTRHPHLGYGPVGARLAATGISYDWRGDALGGMRRAGDEAHHPGLREPLLRAYAEHMRSEVFLDSAGDVLARAGAEMLCLMCAERNPAQCHRSLIADWLALHGARVVHLIGPGEAREHTLHPALHFERGVLRYSRGAAQGELF